jgi:hypothetical protein
VNNVTVDVINQFPLIFLSFLPSLYKSHSCKVAPAQFKKVEEASLRGHSERGAIAAAVGSSILGMGMALTGACPGTVRFV